MIEALIFLCRVAEVAGYGLLGLTVYGFFFTDRFVR